jgi:hypothetical protein
LAAAELLAEIRERCELRVIKRLVRVPEEAVDLGVAARKRTRRAGSGARSASFSSWEGAHRQTPATSTRARSAAAARIAAEFDFGLQSWSRSA